MVGADYFRPYLNRRKINFASGWKRLDKLPILILSDNVKALYHKDIFLLPNLFAAVVNKPLPLTYSRHALLAALDDKYGRFVPPKQLHLESSQVVEVETLNGMPVKWVARISHNDKLDLCIAFVRDGLEYVVKTLWLNERNDCHATLDKNKYAKSA